jgi:hypothetical protein
MPVQNTLPLLFVEFDFALSEGIFNFVAGKAENALAVC